MQSRLAKGISPTTVRFYEVKLGRFSLEVDVDRATQHHIEKFLLQFANLGNRHDYHQAIKTFYIWRERSFGLQNPMKNMPAPKVGKLILPSLTCEQVKTLLDKAEGERDKAIISLFTESGLRLSELTNLKLQDIDWDNHTVRVLGKGNKEGYAPFGTLSEQYLKHWLSQYQPNGTIWGLSKWGITAMLTRLERQVDFPCNPHTFRRTFACLLRKAGVDSMFIKELGRWESIEMVQRYTRSITFNDSLKFYKAPLGQ
jgi:site-specific recombinase XerD